MISVLAMNRPVDMGREIPLEKHGAINGFLAGAEKRAFRFAVVATGNRDEALDIVQDAMIKLVQRDRDRPDSEWGALFQCILQSRIRDWYRRRKTRSAVFGWLDSVGFSQWVENIGGGDRPEDLIEGNEVLSDLERAVHALPLRQQQALILRVWEEYDVAETARIMGCSQGSVKTHLSRAMSALRAAIGGEELCSQI
jgi:RNA polymerase sigma-70 factor (ECF subfamily)